MKPKTWALPKFKLLVEEFQLGPLWTAGLLEYIWHLAATFEAEAKAIGDLPTSNPQMLLAGCRMPIVDSLYEAHHDGCFMTEDKIVDTLVQHGWIDVAEDGTLRVHDWNQHRPAYLEKRDRDREYQRKWRRAKKLHGTTDDTPCQTMSNDVILTSSEIVKSRAPSASASASDIDTDRNLTVSICDDPAGSPPSNGKPTSSDYGFPLRDGKTWYLPNRKLDEYRDTYSDAVNIDHQLKEARQWLRDNKAKRKTANGMPKFLTGWLNRACDSKSATAAMDDPDAILRERRAKRRAQTDDTR